MTEEQYLVGNNALWEQFTELSVDHGNVLSHWAEIAGRVDEFLEQGNEYRKYKGDCEGFLRDILEEMKYGR